MGIQRFAFTVLFSIFSALITAFASQCLAMQTKSIDQDIKDLQKYIASGQYGYAEALIRQGTIPRDGFGMGENHRYWLDVAVSGPNAQITQLIIDNGWTQFTRDAHSPCYGVLAKAIRMVTYANPTATRAKDQALVLINANLNLDAVDCKALDGSWDLVRGIAFPFLGWNGWPETADSRAAVMDALIVKGYRIQEAPCMRKEYYQRCRALMSPDFGNASSHPRGITPDIVRRLLVAGANAHTVDPMGMNLLHWIGRTNLYFGLGIKDEVWRPPLLQGLLEHDHFSYAELTARDMHGLYPGQWLHIGVFDRGLPGNYTGCMIYPGRPVTQSQRNVAVLFQAAFQLVGQAAPPDYFDRKIPESHQCNKAGVRPVPACRCLQYY